MCTISTECSWVDNLVNDHAVLLAQFSVTPNAESTVVKDIRERLDHWRSERAQSDGGSSPELYQPQFFLLWGPYDILVALLVDDTAVVSQLLDIKSVRSQWFTYAVPRKDLSAKDTLELISSRTEDDLPLVGVSRIKLHGFLLHGLGSRVIDRFVRHIRETHETSGRDHRVEAMYDPGFPDVTLIHRSARYRPIADFSLKIQQTLACELCDDRKPFVYWTSLSQGPDSNRSVVSLDQFMSTSHALARTYSVAGVPFAEIFSGSPSTVGDDSERELYPIVRLAMKAGHCQEIRSRLAEQGVWRLHEHGESQSPRSPLSENRTFELGMEDVFLHLASDRAMPLTTAEFHREYSKLHSAVIEGESEPFVPLVETMRTSLGITPQEAGPIEPPPSEPSQVATTHDAVREICRRLDLHEACEQLRNNHSQLPNPTASALLSLLSSYQQLLTDKFQYEHMLELARAARLLGEVASQAACQSDDSPRLPIETHEIDAVIEHFGHAIVNRYGTSIALSEVSDISVEWRGDVHDYLTVMSLAHEKLLDQYHDLQEDPDLPRPATLTVVANVPTATLLQCESQPLNRLSMMCMSGMHLVYPGTIYQILHELGHFTLDYYHSDLAQRLRDAPDRTDPGFTLAEEIYADTFSRTLLEGLHGEVLDPGDEAIASTAFWLYYHLTTPPQSQGNPTPFEIEQLTRFALNVLVREAMKSEMRTAETLDLWRSNTGPGILPEVVLNEIAAVKTRLGESAPGILDRVLDSDGPTRYIGEALNLWVSVLGEAMDTMIEALEGNVFLKQLPDSRISKISREYYDQLTKLTAAPQNSESVVVARPGWRFEVGGRAARAFFRMRVRAFLGLWDDLLGSRFDYIKRVLDSQEAEG